jgi:hypothetical protein
VGLATNLRTSHEISWIGAAPLGRLLQTRIVEHARTHGIRGFTADVLADNAAMLAVFRRSGCQMTSRLLDGAFEVQLLFAPAVQDGGAEPARREVKRRAGIPKAGRRGY